MKAWHPQPTSHLYLPNTPSLPVGHVRSDPIINQTCLSDHVHTFYGPQAVHPATTYEDLINTPDSKTTGNVVENKSLYWHPTIYSYNRLTDTYTRDEISLTSAYYIWENDANTRAFPNGFKMIAGLNPNAPENFPNPEVECVGPSRCRRPDGCFSGNDFFPSRACEELEVSMLFPTCWDGRLDSENHQDHVHYTLNGDLDGRCPSSHPHRLPQIALFFRIMNYDGGWHTFADGSSVFHADYMSGWDENFLQDVLDRCETDSFGPNPDSFCEQFLTFRDAPKCLDEEAQGCDFGDESIISKLEEFQPPPMDILGTVSSEVTDVVVGNLPRGTCTGTLIPPLGGGPTPTAPPVANPTESPVVAPTDSPVATPTDAPVAQPEPTNSPVVAPTTPPVVPTETGGGGGDGEECQNLFELELRTDYYPSETSWKLRDMNSNVVVASGSGYGQDNDKYKTRTKVYDYSACLDGGDYKFSIYDSYGDGLCCDHGEGSYEVLLNGEVLAEGDEFGSSEVVSFSVIANGSIGIEEGSEICEDNADWTLTDKKGKTRDCDWIARRTRTRCDLKGDEDILARIGCPETCDECDF